MGYRINPRDQRQYLPFFLRHGWLVDASGVAILDLLAAINAEGPPFYNLALGDRVGKTVSKVIHLLSPPSPFPLSLPHYQLISTSSYLSCRSNTASFIETIPSPYLQRTPTPTLWMCSLESHTALFSSLVVLSFSTPFFFFFSMWLHRSIHFSLLLSSSCSFIADGSRFFAVPIHTDPDDAVNEISAPLPPPPSLFPSLIKSRRTSFRLRRGRKTL